MSGWLGRAAVLALVIAGLPPLPSRHGGDGAAVTGTVAVIGKAGRVDDSSGVVVWLEPAAETAAERAPVGPLHPRPRVVQRRKQFEPHLLVVTVGSSVEFPNLDPYFHNVFSLFDGKRFDLGLYEAGTSRTVTFTKAGVCYVFCNIHPEMSAVVVAVDTPYYAVSTRAGAFSIPGVPPGRYTATAWHERHKLERPRDVPREVRVAAAGASLGEFRFAESAQLTVAHKDKYGQDYLPPRPGSPIYISK